MRIRDQIAFILSVTVGPQSPGASDVVAEAFGGRGWRFLLARIPDTIFVTVFLLGVGDFRTVVHIVTHAVFVAVYTDSCHTRRPAHGQTQSHQETAEKK
jgi:hypothetical protein